MPRITQNRQDAESLPVIWTESILIQTVARIIEWWRYTIIPNVYLGGGHREIDLAVLSKSGGLANPFSYGHIVSGTT